MLGLAALTALLAAPRFGDTTPDSRHYLAVAAHCEGAAIGSPLRRPFAYRVALPCLVSRLPGRPGPAGFAAANVLLTVTAYVLFAGFLARLSLDPEAQRLALLLLVVSFPTVDYASRVLTDPGGFAVLTAGAWLLAAGRTAWLVPLVAVGVLFRESSLSLAVAAAWLGWGGGRGGRAPLWGGLAALAAMALVRSQLPGVEGFGPDADLWKLDDNLIRPVSWLSSGLTLAPALLVWAAGAREPDGVGAALAPASRDVLLALAVSQGLLVAYALGFAFMSGRFAWMLYPALLPVAATAGLRSAAVRRWLLPAARLAFGR